MAGGWYVRPASPDPQPLDLSSKPPKPPSPSKTIFKAKPRLPAVGGRRSYTEDELQAALRDIQSGKLGTRRAAVIYGIPRSTLRNKVYKISQESRDYPCLEGERGDEEEEDEERELSGAEEEREAERLLNRPFSYDELVRLTSGTSWPCLQQLLGGPGGPSTSSGEEPLRRAALAFAAASAAPGSRNGDTVSPPVPPIIINKDQPLDFRRDVRPPPHHNNNNISASNKNNNHLDDKKTTPANASNMTTGGGKAQQGGKGTRPKRGKYRNYDRDSLVEAVRAVQRGEMSVHRAGSYYGVPHSTLEYKVKERHLMRPRKREPKTQQQQQGQSVPSGVTPTAPAATVDDKRKEEEKRAPQVRTPTLTPPLPANGLKIPPFLDPTIPQLYRPPFPYWQPPFPLPFGRPDLFAAQELVARRLAAQQPPTSEAESIALSKNAREIAESLLEGTENGSFLDGIIRSSLDTGLPSRESGGGKVLLEQLCRGVMPERQLPQLQTTSEPTSPGSCSGSGSQRATSPSSGPPPAKRATPSPPGASPPAPPSTSASPPSASPPPPSSPADTRPPAPLSPSSPAPPSSPHQSC